MKISKNFGVYFGYSLILLKYIFSCSAFRLPDALNVVLTLVGIICFLQKILTTKYTQKELFLIIVSLVYAFYVIIHIGDDFMLLLILFLISLKDLQLGNLVRIYLVDTGMCFVGFIACSIVTGQNVIIASAYREENVIISRYALGYSHPNALHGAYMHIVAALVLTDCLKKHKTIKYVVLAVINWLLFELSDSRAGFVVVTLILFLAYFKEGFLKVFNRRTFFFTIVVLVLGIITFGIFATYNFSKYPLLYAINEMITGRFLHASRFTAVYPVTLLGTDISKMASTYTLDCGIISTLLTYGIFGMFFCTTVYCVGLYGLWKESKYTEMIVVLAFVIYSLIESVFINPFSNLAFLICVYFVTNLKPYYYRDKNDGHLVGKQREGKKYAMH